MLQRLIRIGLMSILLVASQVWALGLGEIRLSSALNEPLRAEIDLLSATPEELASVKITLASAETFERYGLDRPAQLTGIQFRLESNAQTGTDVVRITSTEPMTEPFLTFLVEAEWPRGRLLREYTVLLDPPTFAPAPVAQTSQPVTAPTQSRPADSGTISRPPAQQPTPAPRPAPQPPVASPREEVEPAAPAPAPAPEPAQPAADFDTTSGGQYSVQRGDTLWQIADRFRPDERLTMNQTMLGIFEANPQAFDGNINRLSSGANLRIPSADEIFRISRGEANAEAQRQNEAYASGTPLDDAAQPSLTLIPPDDEPADFEAVDEPPVEPEPVIEEPAPAVALTDEQRIFEIEQLLLDHQDSIIEIDDSELAVLRAELARLRGEEYVEPVEPEVPAVEEPVVVEETPDPAPVEESAPPVVAVADEDSGGFVDSLISAVTGFWGILIGGLAIAIGTLLFFARRAALAPEDDATGVWNALDADDVDNETVASTQRIRALSQEDDSSIVVVEVDSTPVPPSHEDTVAEDATIEPFIGGAAADATVSPSDTIAFETVPAPSTPEDFVQAPEPSIDDSLEDILGDQPPEPTTSDDTYSSDTAINFDQSDPIAEADFHMAYGLYDQAADLINGALVADPNRQDLLGKLCETYFVWGNRDAFVDAASRLNAAIGEDKSNSEWDKIIIMGQQIAGDHEMFAGVSAGAATKAVDLSLDADIGDFGGLDMDLAGDGPDGVVSGVIDLGDDDGRDASTVVADDSVDFMFDGDDLAESGTRQMPGAFGAGEETAESPTMEQPGADATAEMSGLDEPFGSLDATGEMLSAGDLVSEDDDISASSTNEQLRPDATAEIELDDLGLDLGGLSEAQIDDMAGDDLGEDDLGELDYDSLDEFAATAETPTLAGEDDFEDFGATTETPTISQEIDSDDFDETAETPVVSAQDVESATGQNLGLGEATAETGKNPEVDVEDLGDAVISTGVHGIPDYDEGMDATGEIPALELPDAGQRDASGGGDEGSLSMGIDSSLLDATGQTQILTGELAVEAERKAKEAIGDHDETMLAPPRGDDEETLLAPRRDEDATMVATPGDNDETMLAPHSESDETIEAPLDTGDVEMDDFEFNKTEALPRHAFTELADTGDTGEMTLAAGSTDMELDLEDLTAALKVSELQEQDFLVDTSEDETVEQPLPAGGEQVLEQDIGESPVAIDADGQDDLQDARTMTEVGTKLDLARAYVDMGDPDGARSILEEVLVEGDDAQQQQAQQLLDSLPG